MAVADQDCISFSFRYLDTTKAKFSIAGCKGGHLVKLCERAKAISQLDRKGLLALQQEGAAWRFHRITWNEVSEPTFGLHATLCADENAWQFELSKATGRIHGFLVGSKFFVRWLDPEHNLYKK